MNVLPADKQVTIISALTEGCSIRTTERMTGVHRDTIMRLGVRIGEACHRLHDSMMHDFQPALVELDEQWAFIAKKQKRVKQGEIEKGDCWVWIALDAVHKAVISYSVGKRTAEHAQFIANDLRARILNRPQITSDGLAAYIPAVDIAFGVDVDFAQLVKTYQAPPEDDAAHRYSPSAIRSIEKTVIRGIPNESKISTSYIERFNLTTRMAMRRFTRLTNGFSKKLANHKAAIALHIAHYNFCRVHETLRITPAMAVGVTDHVWSIAELIERATALPETAPSTPRPPTTIRPGHERPRLRVVRGGRI
jgi:IS1 family transposase